MGTRSLTIVRDGDFGQDNQDQEITVIYRQMDGYPSGHGKDLKDKFQGFRIINGIGLETARVANGMRCFAAQLVAALKDGVGSIYLYPPGTREAGEEYVYTLSDRAGRLWLDLTSGYDLKQKPLYSGFLDDFNPQMEEPEGN